MLSGPRLDRSDTGEVSGLTLTGDDKITLYNFLRDVNQARNNKITEKPRASENNQGRESPERLQDPIGEKNKHDHEENSLHDHWGEAEHTHSHQVMSSSHLFPDNASFQESSAAQAGHEETHEHSHTHTHYHDHNHIRKHSENHQHLAEYFFSGWKR